MKKLDCIKEVNACIVQGDEKAYPLTFKRKDGVPFDLTGCRLIYRAVKNLDDDPIINIVKTNHEDAVNGETVITLTKEDTNIPRGNYSYSIIIDGGGFNPATVMYGNLKISWQAKGND